VKGASELWIGGRREVELVLRLGSRPVREVWLAEGREEAVAEEIGSLCRAAGVPCRRVPRGKLDELVPGSNNGVAARVGERRGASLEEALAGAPVGSRLAYVLDGVEDPRNFGAILRSAAAFGAAGVFFRSAHSAPLSAAAVKASAGGSEIVPLVPVANIRSCLDRLRKEGFWVYGADAGGRRCDEVDLRGDVALVLGAEGEGLRRLTREVCDETIAVPIRAEIESLNVSAVAAILGWEVRRQGKWGDGRTSAPGSPGATD
jgi:23S rRNA (guanosine2251-2'-O)-methyltransferase